MMGLLSSNLMKATFFSFLLTWGVGFVLRIINDPSRRSDIDRTSMPAFRQIRVIGALRWLFGYKPITGSVSLVGAILQLAAFLTVGITMTLASLWPAILSAIYWIPLVVWALAILFAFRFLMWLWDKQQGGRIEAKTTEE